MFRPATSCPNSVRELLACRLDHERGHQVLSLDALLRLRMAFVSGFTKCDQEAIYQGRYSPNLLASAFAVVLGCFVHYCKSESGIANDDASECLFLWAFSQGIQNGITRRCSSLPVCTTHFTGYLTDFGVGLGLWARAQADGRRAAHPAEGVPVRLRHLLLRSRWSGGPWRPTLRGAPRQL